MCKRHVIKVAVLALAASAFGADGEKQTAKAPITVVGYLRDAGCVHRYPEVSKPLPNGCLEACVRAGSPLVILSEDGRVYHPFSNQIPDKDVRKNLLPFAGKLVRVTGNVYERGGSTAISVDRIEEAKQK